MTEVILPHVQLALSSDSPGEWRITSGDTYLVGFYGPDAYAHAAQRRRELSELLRDATDNGAESADETPRPLSKDA